MSGPWRHPDEESVDLYPGLVVHDGRVSGSITAGRSRLPLWAFSWEAITRGWGEVETGYEPGRYGIGAEDFAQFVTDLLEQRGEFGRLVLGMRRDAIPEGTPTYRPTAFGDAAVSHVQAAVKKEATFMLEQFCTRRQVRSNRR